MGVVCTNLHVTTMDNKEIRGLFLYGVYLTFFENQKKRLRPFQSILIT